MSNFERDVANTMLDAADRRIAELDSAWGDRKALQDRLFELTVGEKVQAAESGHDAG
jgi:hypothetical protein